MRVAFVVVVVQIMRLLYGSIRDCVLRLRVVNNMCTQHSSPKETRVLRADVFPGPTHIMLSALYK